MKNKKILYIVSNLKKCGPINILYNLVKYIDKDKYSISIVCLSKVNENSREMEFKDLGCNIYKLNLDKISSILFSKKKILDISKQNDIDIIHSHGIRPDMINSKIKDFKTVSTLHNYPYHDYSMTYGKLLGNIFAKYHINILRKINKVYACSKTLKDMLNNEINIEYVQNGVDDRVFTTSSEKEKIYLRKKLKLPIDDKIFIVVGDLSIRKNITMIIKCFIMRKKENEKLIFIGNGDLYKESKKLIGENKNIYLKGKVNNVDDYLKASDYYISASLAEGLPNSVLEAMSTGIPCILSDIPPHIELSCDKIQLFKSNDIYELLKTIDCVKKQDYKYLQIKSRETIEKYLSANIMAKKYELKYDELL